MPTHGLSTRSLQTGFGAESVERYYAWEPLGPASARNVRQA
jgi:hypothetical protein